MDSIGHERLRTDLDLQPGYEGFANDLVQQLTELRSAYRDTSGLPVKVMPIYD